MFLEKQLVVYKSRITPGFFVSDFQVIPFPKQLDYMFAITSDVVWIDAALFYDTKKVIIKKFNLRTFHYKDL